MAVNKNFVVKNGLEVDTNLLVANAATNKVGIASTGPRVELDVRGGIAATDISISGVGTIVTLQSTTGTITNLSGTNLNYSGIATANSISIGATQVISNTRQLQSIASLDATTTATIEAAIANAPNTFTDLTVTGFSTFNAISAGNVTLAGITTGLNAPGISTLGFIQGTNLNIIGFSTLNAVSAGNLTLSGIVTGINAPGISTFGDTTISDLLLAGITTGLNASGISTLGFVQSTNLSVSGVSTLGTVQVSSGIVTAVSGVVTYYGDGSKLTGIATGLTASIGIQSGGTVIGTGVTTINVVGTGFTAETTGTTANLYLPSGGVSLGLAIALGG